MTIHPLPTTEQIEEAHRTLSLVAEKVAGPKVDAYRTVLADLALRRIGVGRWEEEDQVRDARRVELAAAVRTFAPHQDLRISARPDGSFQIVVVQDEHAPIQEDDLSRCARASIAPLGYSILGAHAGERPDCVIDVEPTPS